MSKRLALLALLFLFLLLCGAAAALEARDVTASCDIGVSSNSRAAHRLTDRKTTTIWESDGGSRTVTIQCPVPAWGLYICWGREPRAWTLEQKVAGVWQTSDIAPSPFLHVTVPLLGATEIKLKPAGNNRAWFAITELYVLGEGDTPGWAQQWRLPEGDCDLLVLFAHPDDEALFFGGTIPTYAGERGLDVVAAVLSAGSPIRRGELLDSLWTMGLRQYPIVGGFEDKHSLKLATAYKNAGETKVKRFVTELLRSCQPKVVVTHDQQGEYGHGMHKMCADAALYAFDAAADAAKFRDSVEKYGVWQVGKLYLHLYPENPVVMDWDLPLTAFGGLTGFAVSKEAYQCHQSQLRLDFTPQSRDDAYSSYRFGLARSIFGEDRLAPGDFMENVFSGAFTVRDAPEEGK